MDELDISEWELRTFMDDVRKLNRCIVCKAILNVPVVTCQQGHLSCTHCQKEKCVICKSIVVTDVQLSTVEEWLQLMPRQCEFSNRGCKAIILPSSPHESYCPYSHTCKLCNAVGHIVKHFEAEHEEHVSSDNEFNFFWTSVPEKTYCVLNGTLFRLSIREKKGFVTTEVYCVKTKRTDTDFIYTLKYRQGRTRYTYTGNVLDYKSVDKYDEDNENFMKFPASNLRKLYEDGIIKYTLRISKLELESASLES